MGLTLNTKEAIRDFQSYDRKTQQEFEKALKVYSMLMSSSQGSWLRRNVKQWTGFLGGSIAPKRKNKTTYWIGPILYRVIYDWFIERGGRGFGGYHYVQYSIDKHRDAFNRRIKKIVETTKK